MEAKVFDIIWANVGSKVKPKDAQPFRLVCRFWRDVVDSTVTKLELTGPREHWLKVAEQWNRFPALKELIFRFGSLPIALSLPSFTDCKWEKLEKIRFYGGGEMDELAAETLSTAVTKSWKNLKILDFHAVDLRPSAVLKFAAVPWPQLEELRLYSSATKFKSEENGNILAAFLSKCPSLKKLSLVYLGLGDDALDQVMDVKLPHLEEFDAERNDLTSKAGHIIAAKASSWPCLSNLNLRINRLGLDGLKALCKANFPLLEELNVQYNFGSKNQIGRQEMEIMRTSMETLWTQMKVLHINVTVGNARTTAAYVALLQGFYPHLEELDTIDGLNGEERLYALADANKKGRLPSYKSLQLHIFDITEIGAFKSVLASPWPKLETLRIRSYYMYLWNDLATCIRRSVENNHVNAVKYLELCTY